MRNKLTFLVNPLCDNFIIKILCSVHKSIDLKTERVASRESEPGKNLSRAAEDIIFLATIIK